MATYDSRVDNRRDRMSGPADTAAPRESNPPAMAAAGLNLIVGAWLFIAHWVLGYTGADPTWNDVIFGLAIILFAIVRLTGIPATRFFSTLNMTIGVWLIIAALTLTDSTAALVNNLICGAVVLVIAGVAAMAPSRESRRADTGR